jgi:hypothetical protein
MILAMTDTHTHKHTLSLSHTHTHFGTQLKGNLVSVPPDRRQLIRDRVMAVFSRELPSYTHEAWRFESEKTSVSLAPLPLHSQSLETRQGQIRRVRS